MPRHTPNPPSWLAKALYSAAVRLYPRFATPNFGQPHEILICADGFQGAVLLKETRRREHISVYWPGRGVHCIAGQDAARVTFLERGISLTSEEYAVLRNRVAPLGDWSFWMEL